MMLSSLLVSIYQCQTGSRSVTYAYVSVCMCFCACVWLLVGGGWRFGRERRRLERGGGGGGCRYRARITGEEVEKGEPGWKKGAGLTEEGGGASCKRAVLRQKWMTRKGFGPRMWSVYLSVWVPVIHRLHYFQTELRLCSLACASLIMQIWAVRQNITAAISQSRFRRYTNISAFVSVSLATLKWNDSLASRAAEGFCRFTWAASHVVCEANQSGATEELKDVAVLLWFGLRHGNVLLTLWVVLIAAVFK